MPQKIWRDAAELSDELMGNIPEAVSTGFRHARYMPGMLETYFQTAVAAARTHPGLGTEENPGPRLDVDLIDNTPLTAFNRTVAAIEQAANNRRFR